MQTKYPKNKISKKIELKKTSKPVFDEIVTEQQAQIDDLKSKAESADANNALFLSKKPKYDDAYSDTIFLKQDMASVTRNAAYAHDRINTLEESISAIETNGTNNTEQLMAMNTTITQIGENTVVMGNKVTAIENSVDAMQTQVSENSARIDEIIPIINGHGDSISEHSSAIVQIQEQQTQQDDKILQNTNSILTNSTDIDNLSTDVQANCNSIETLTQSASQNAQNIQDLTDSLQTLSTQTAENSQRLDALEQNASSAGTAELESQITELSGKVQSNSSRLNILEENVNNVDFEDLQQSMTTLTTQVEQNTQVIQDWQTTTESLRSACDNIETDHQNLLEQNQNLQASVNTNTINIQNLQNQVDINTAKIEILQNSGTSGSSSELDLVDLTQQVEQNSANIVSLQTQQNINTADIASLLAFKQKFTTPSDEHYCPKTYSDYPAGTIVQTYACYERELYLNNTNLVTVPTAYFLAEAGSEGTIKVSLDLKTEATTQELLIETYLNSNVINSQIIVATPELKTYNLDIYDTALNTETKQNTICCKIRPGSYGRFYVYKSKIELIAPNADLIKIIKPYNVEYIDGKYYVSDCSDGRAKLAVIEKQNMFNMGNLAFEDKGYEAQSLVVGASTKSYSGTYVYNNFAEIYVQKNDKMYSHDQINNHTTNNTNYKSMDWLPYATNNIKFMTNSYSDLLPKFAYIYESNGNMGIGSMKSLATNVVKTYAVKFLGELNKLLSTNTFASITGDGQVILTHNGSTLEKYNINLGYGTSARLYYDYLTTASNYALNVFIKRYDKIVKYYITLDSTNGYVIQSITEVGSYEDFFLGAKDDYFVVKNGKLNYHFFPEETTDQTDNTQQSETTE